MNASSAGRGVFFGPGHPWNVSERADGPPTNNRGEIQASRRAIEIAKANGVPKLRINTDSDFLVKSVNNYMPKWKENGWKTSDNRDVVNKDDFMRLDRELDGSIEVEFVRKSRLHDFSALLIAFCLPETRSWPQRSLWE